MSRLLPVLLSALILSIPFSGFGESVPTFRFGAQEEGRSVLAGSLFMEQRIDGKPSGREMVVDIGIERTGAGYTVNWDVVVIHAIDLPNGEKYTSLKALHYGTDTESIRNVVVTDGFLSFDIVRAHGDIKVEISRKGAFGSDIAVKAYRNRFSNKRQKTVNEEWVMKDRIRLPSLDVIPHPGKKPGKG